MVYKKNPKFLTQVQYCEQQAVPLMVVIGEEEMKNGGVKVRNVKTQEEVKGCMKVCTQPIGFGLCDNSLCSCLSSWTTLCWRSRRGFQSSTWHTVVTQTA